MAAQHWQTWSDLPRSLKKTKGMSVFFSGSSCFIRRMNDWLVDCNAMQCAVWVFVFYFCYVVGISVISWARFGMCLWLSLLSGLWSERATDIRTGRRTGRQARHCVVGIWNQPANETTNKNQRINERASNWADRRVCVVFMAVVLLVLVGLILFLLWMHDICVCFKVSVTGCCF